MTILFASDHAGFELKEELIEFVKTLGYKIEDMGAYEYDQDDDYPDYVAPLARRIAEGDATETNASANTTLTTPPTLGIIIGGSGQGEAICANRFPNARAVVYYGGEEKILKLSKEHNNANILSLGARFIDTEEAKKATKKWLEAHFSEEERHERRIRKIDTLERTPGRATSRY